ncbi:hypothetical protein N6H14_18075 [Paenibacillus sp. CC-CFT747]|nr:hypothetical protein N6H14_18075 [Paenibacillus sp. CC-CFT747]
MRSIQAPCIRKIHHWVTLVRKGMKVAVWSIHVFPAGNGLTASPNDALLRQPSLAAADVTDVPAEFVADPFLVQHQSEYYLFFEVLNKASGRGEIAVASSSDGREWFYERVVLQESFHLSYPQVFEHNGEMYMLPESIEANRVQLYKAKSFPYEWEPAGELLGNVRYLDPSLLFSEGRWWMFAGTEEGDLRLFYAEDLFGPWSEHACSPIVTHNKRISRPGGRVIRDGKTVYRYTQSAYPDYGGSVSAFRILKLTVDDYEEEEVGRVLGATNREGDWHKDGMHHVDQLRLTDGRWLVAVDGHRCSHMSYPAWKLSRWIAKLIY